MQSHHPEVLPSNVDEFCTSPKAFPRLRGHFHPIAFLIFNQLQKKLAQEITVTTSEANFQVREVMTGFLGWSVDTKERSMSIKFRWHRYKALMF
jgi:hypothetical protein